uniref:GntR family transcriptional regulator n=1 Tax=Pararhizobium sp. IMCC3301 TaxID=3067904 RepID=UPI002740C0A5|nr:GntR family transcriptional regulator [Pararhizobium sp. IMCC3301]
MKLSANVTERIRNDIVEGVFDLGEHLSINRLAARYETSHMPIRGALRELAGDGIVIFEPNKGARVRAPDKNFIVDLMEMRASIESVLARRAAERAVPADIKKLEEIQSRMETALDAAEYDQALSANHTFHNTINEIAGSKDAASIVSRNWLLLATLWQKFGYDNDRFVGVVNDHRQIIAALAAADSLAAEAIMAAHVHKSKLDLIKVM